MDEMYIKMAKEAVEIQEGWKPKDGDMFLFEDKDTEESFIDYCPAYTSQKIETEEDKFHLNFYKENCIYLPRQEDLQKIVLIKKWHDVDRLLDEFISGWNMPTGQFNDLTTLWLCFVMETCYHKHWNTETQTWETTQ